MSIQRRIARTWLAQATRSSLTPFLYQTRTLTAPRLCPTRFTSQPCSSFSTSDSPSQPPPAEQQTTTENDDSAAQKSDRTPANERSSTVDPAPAPRKSYLKRKKATSSSQHHVARRSPKLPSMTRCEKQALGELLGKLGIDEAEDPKEAVVRKPRESSDEEHRQEMEQISAIFDSVVQEMRKKQKRLEATATANSAEGREDADRDARIDDKLHPLLYSDEEVTELIINNQVSPARAIELVVRREGAKIEMALHAAVDEGQGEAGIWNVCKEKIFPMVRYLSDDSETSSVLRGIELPDHGDPHEDGAQSATDTATTSPGPLDVPANVPIEIVVTRLYPKMLLVGFRLLSLHFPDSPLIGKFRSTIQSLGRVSAVLGGSTELYNELIYFYWRGCFDLPSVVSLLAEMEVTGVEADRRTAAVLKTIVQQREMDLKRRRKQVHGVRSDPWWDLAANRKALRELIKPDGWIQRVEERLVDKKARKNYMYERGT